MGPGLSQIRPLEVLVQVEEEPVARRALELVAAEAWRIDSVVRRINTSDGTDVAVDDETARLIAFGIHLHEISEGKFDITSGSCAGRGRSTVAIASRAGPASSKRSNTSAGTRSPGMAS